MAIISSYPTVVAEANDLLIGTKVTNTGTVINPTKTFRVQEVVDAALGYKVYTAQLEAGAGVAPTVTILQNTTGLTFTWTRTGVGNFLATVAGTPFIANKFWAISQAKVPQITSVVRTSTNTARLDVVDSSTAVAVDGIASGFIEIRIYN